MTQRAKSGRISAGPARIRTVICMVIMALMLAGCQGSGAKAKVRSELDRLQTSETAAGRMSEVQEMLPAESGKDFEAFLAKVRDFDYEIIGTEELSDDSGEYTLVTVKIITYDFGKEYLATWTDYIRSHKNASIDDADGKEFYGELFARLSKLTDKQYISYVDIKAMEPMDNGEWVTDVSSNAKLQDALFGGMMGEIRTLAGE